MPALPPGSQSATFAAQLTWYFLTSYEQQLKGSEPKPGTIEQRCNFTFHTDAILHLANTKDYLYCIKCNPSIFLYDDSRYWRASPFCVLCCNQILQSLKIRRAKTETGGNQSMQKSVENLRLVLITSIANKSKLLSRVSETITQTQGRIHILHVSYKSFNKISDLRWRAPSFTGFRADC